MKSIKNFFDKKSRADLKAFEAFKSARDFFPKKCRHFLGITV